MGGTRCELRRQFRQPGVQAAQSGFCSQRYVLCEISSCKLRVVNRFGIYIVHTCLKIRGFIKVL